VHRQNVQRLGRLPLIAKRLKFAFRSMAAVLGVCLFWGAPVAVPQSSSPQIVTTPYIDADRTESGRLKLRVDVRLTLVPISVTDSQDRPVTGLEPESFRVFEDNVEQEILYFSKEEVPVSVAIVFDTSGSMRSRMEQSVSAIQLFLRTAIEGDEFSLVRFSDKPSLLTRFADNPEDVFQALNFMQPKGWTAMRDAIFVAARELKSANNFSRALLILSDGSDNNSRHSESETRNLVLESDVRVFAIGLFDRPRFLERIAKETGGAAVLVHKLEELPQAIARMSRTIRNQYLAVYASNNPQEDGKYRKIKVHVTPPSHLGSLVVRSRKGYYATPE
jgi:Ca-activated chloride channel family protein